MTRFLRSLRLELTLQYRQKFLHAAIFSGLVWLAVLLPIPPRVRAVVEPYILLGDIALIGFFFIGGVVFFEKQERTLGALISTPLRFWEYLAAKLAVLLAVTLCVAIVVVTVSHGFGCNFGLLVVGVALGALLMLLVGFVTSLPFTSVSGWFMVTVIPLTVMSGLPVLYYSGVWPHPIGYLIPTLGPLLLLGSAFDQVVLAPWQVVYALVYSAVCVSGLAWLAKQLFGRYIIERSGGL